ncbi:hypothetical protein GCM10027612_37060 [Microbispora bryophytorum subsp. camponoti]
MASRDVARDGGPDRHFLSFDGRDGGRAAEVFGDLATADRIAVVVPGSGTGLDTYGLLRGGSMRLQRAIGGRGPSSPGSDTGPRAP